MSNATPIRVVVIDDEPLARERMRMFLARHHDIELVAEAGDGQEALRVLETARPDVVFVDVEMPERSGLDVIRSLDPADRPLVVFVTAHTSYAVDAFDIGAVHYLVKPFGPEEVGAAVRRLRQSLAARETSGAVSKLLDHLEKQRPSETLERVVVKRNGRALLLRVDQIDWIEAAGNYSRLHVGGDRHLLRETMATLEQKLDGRRFVRVHRSTVINIDRVAELQPTSHGDWAVILQDGTRLVLSRGYRARLETLLGRL